MTALLFWTVSPEARGQSTWYSAYEMALEEISAGRWEQAIGHLQRSLELKPEPELDARTYGVWRRDYLPFYYLGLSHYNLGHDQKALKWFERSLEAGENRNSPDRLALLNSYRNAILEKAARAAPDSALKSRIDAELDRGIRLAEEGQLEEATVRFESVLTLDPENAAARENLLRIRAEIARRDAASEQIANLMSLGTSQMDDGNLEDAQTSFEEVLKLQPGHQEATALLDSLRHRMGRIAEISRRYVALADSLRILGDSLFSRQRLEEAGQYFRRALALDAADTLSREMVRRIEGILEERDRSAQQAQMLEEAERLLAHDSLIVARDRLRSALDLGPNPRADSLYRLVEGRFAESERRLRMQEAPQLVLDPSDTSLTVKTPRFTLRGSATDYDGIVEVRLDYGGVSKALFVHNGPQNPPATVSFEDTLVLARGVNPAEITVTDGQGNRAVARRLINYEPGLWRNPLFRYALALILLAAAAGYYYQRRNAFHILYTRLRRRPFELIAPNPFIVGNPIRSREMFFGREDDFRYVKNKVDNEKYGSLIVLFGERRAGKTSVLYQILGGKLGPDYLPVFVDMQAMAINDDHEFLGRVAEITLEAIGPGRVDFDPAPFADQNRNPYTLFEKFVDKVLEAVGENKLLFLVDEYELIEDKVQEMKISKDIFHFLSGLVEHKPGLFLIFAGNHRLADRSNRYWEPLLQRCDYRNISYLTPNDTRRLIHEPVRGKVFYLGTTVRVIMRLTAGQPFYTQLVCRNIVELLNNERRNFFYDEDIANIVREIIDNPPPQLIYFWAGLDAEEKLTLSAIAEATRNANHFPEVRELAQALKKYSVAYPGEELNKVCSRLLDREILERDSGDSYRFRMDLYRLWIREEHDLYSVSREFERETITR
ncbi:MAG: tetratricopeptide repeat protein [Candidatus Glassbacteria bacterium]